MKWLPIETAPKNGSSVLLTDGEVIVVAWWDDDWIIFENNDAHLFFENATHWQQLPEMPK